MAHSAGVAINHETQHIVVSLLSLMFQSGLPQVVSQILPRKTKSISSTQIEEGSMFLSCGVLSFKRYFVPGSIYSGLGQTAMLNFISLSYPIEADPKSTRTQSSNHLEWVEVFNVVRTVSHSLQHLQEVEQHGIIQGRGKKSNCGIVGERVILWSLMASLIFASTS